MNSKDFMCIKKSYTIKNILDSMLLIPSGFFTMGSTMETVNNCVNFWGDKLVDENYTKDIFRQWILKEYPPFEINVSAFYVSKFPITNGQYKTFVSDTGYKKAKSLLTRTPDNHPVWGVSLGDTNSFMDWLTQETGHKFRLPTEAEWEYAAKGNENNEYPFGKVYDRNLCNTRESGIGYTTPVDKYSKFSSPFGVCDLPGNVEEWTSDTYNPYPNGMIIEDDLYKTLGANYPIIRGGSFIRGGDLARSSRRHGPFPSEDYKFIGFRIVASLF